METRSALRAFRVVTVLLLAISAVLWISCGGGGGGAAVSSKRLSWDAPSQFADGGALVPAEDLSSYEIYINETGVFLDTDTPKAVIPAVNVSSGTPVTTHDLATITPSLETGKIYYLSMRTIEKNGGRSDFTAPPLQFTY